MERVDNTEQEVDAEVEDHRANEVHDQNQPPESHALGGDIHDAATRAGLNALVSDATLESESGAQSKADAAESSAESYADTQVSDHNSATAVHGVEEVFDAANYTPESDTHSRYTDNEAQNALVGSALSVAGDNFLTLEDGSGGSNSSPYGVVFDTRNLQFIAGDGTGGVMTLFQNGGVNYPVGPVAVGGEVLATRQFSEDEVETHRTEDQHTEPQPPATHDNTAHSIALAVDGDAQPPETHGDGAHEYDLQIDGQAITSSDTINFLTQ